MQDRAISIVRVYLEVHKDEILPKNLDMAAYILVTTTEAITHSALLGGRVLEQTPLEDELVALVLRYLGVEDTR